MMTRRKRLIFSAIAALFPLTALFLASEASLRLKQAKSTKNEARREVDPQWGWRPTADLVREGEAMDALRRKSRFRMTQESHGFRLWGDTATTRPRVLILGDSYTQADDIDDSKTFAARLAQRMTDAEFWAFGCSGYGNFQELMVLEKYADTIKPNVLLLQLSSNDVINNLLELESAMPFLATPGPRPYLMDDGTVRFHLATRHSGLRKHSFAYASLVGRLERLVFKDEIWVPGRVRQYGAHRTPPDFDTLLDKTTIRTAHILNRMKNAVGPETRIIAFYDEDVIPLTASLKQACVLAGVPLVDSVGPTLMAEEGRRKAFVYRTIDQWHWNDDGHEVVAGILEGPLREALEAAGYDTTSQKPEALARDEKPGDTSR